jgi:hypothetical protein
VLVYRHFIKYKNLQEVKVVKKISQSSLWIKQSFLPFTKLFSIVIFLENRKIENVQGKEKNESEK